MSEENKKPARTNAEIVAETTIADVYHAAKQLEGVARKTRLIHSDFFSELCHNDVWLKPKTCSIPAYSSCAAHTTRSAS